MRTRFHRLRIAATHRETRSATSVDFEVPEALRETFRWRPGQHLTLRFYLDGEEARRSYSISSSAFTGEPLRITVKRVPGGLLGVPGASREGQGAYAVTDGARGSGDRGRRDPHLSVPTAD